MESAYLFKTGYTAADTQVYHPTTPSVYDQSVLSQSNFGQRYPPSINPQPAPQRIISAPIQSQPILMSQPYIQQGVPVRPATSQPFQSTVIRSVPLPYHLIQQHQQTMIRAPAVQILPEEQILVYCPVCKRDYLANQADLHAQNHNLLNQYNFAPAQSKNQYIVTNSNRNINMSQYPLVQPLEFWTNQIQNSSRNDIYILKQYKNYDGVDPQYFNPPKQKQTDFEGGETTIHRHEQIIQPQPQPQPQPYHQVVPQVVTPQHSQIKIQKPPLQLQSNSTDLYNCFDNIVNGEKGPKFSFKDITQSNNIITPKRQLEGYIIQSKYNKNNPNNSAL